MATDTKGIFVSYRRGESDAHAGRLADRFIEHFGEHRVFYDVDLTEPGVDFIDQIQSAVDSSEVLIAVIGKNWVTATDSAGQKWLEKPDDYVRIEIATALKRNIRVMPLLVQGAAMPSAHELPNDLTPLTHRRAFELHDASWRKEVQDLTTVLESVVGRKEEEGEEPGEQKPHKEEPSPPQGQDSSDSTLREGAQRGILVAPRPRWRQIGVAVLLAGLITEFPQLIWGLATWVEVNFPSYKIVFGILHPLTLLCGLWAGLAWPGRHPKGLAVLGSFAGLLDLAINWSIAVIMGKWWANVWYIDRLDFLSAIGIAALFTAGGLFGDLIESWRLPRRREESEVVRGIAQKASGPRRQPSESTLKLVQALGPSLLALLGLLIGVIAKLLE
jgi:TIR domain